MSSIVMIVGIALIGLAIVLILATLALSPRGQTGVGRSMAVLEALTSAPKEMKTELDAPFADRVLVPLIGRAQGSDAGSRRPTPANASTTSSSSPATPPGGPRTGSPAAR